MITPREHKTITPKPYFNIIFGCSNRSFYEVKDYLWDLCLEIDPDQNLWDNVEESCDYEGDLDEITIYNSDKTKELIKRVFEHYEIKEDIPESMHIILSIY